MNESKLIQQICTYEKIYIFGAHVRGRTLNKYLHIINPQLEVVAYLVDDLGNNPDFIENIPVYNIGLLGELRDIPVFIATKMIYHEKITEQLKMHGIKQIILNTPEVDNAVKKVYFKEVFRNKNKDFLMLSEYDQKEIDKSIGIKHCNIYMVTSVFDSAEVHNRYDEPWLLKIQAGAALTDRVIAQITDDTGENISYKNRKYCELTAIYWIWKNEQKEYVGICHYRRRFVLNQQMISFMVENQVDVVLPVPTGCEPSIMENYYERHRRRDWEVMMRVLEKDYPQYFVAAQKVFQSNFYYACNMWIMKTSVLNEFAAWLFDILEKIEKKTDESEDLYQRRYIGFLAERLTTLYFICNWDKLHIVHADKLFII